MLKKEKGLARDVISTKTISNPIIELGYGFCRNV